MSCDHDPAKHASYLRQVLSLDKRPLGLLVGAGCPVAIRVGGANAPLIPDIAGVTVAVRAELEKSKVNGPLLKRLLAHFDEDGKKSATIEDFLGHVRALRVVAGTQRVRSFSAADLDTLDAAISASIVSIVDRDLPEGPSPYEVVAGWVRAIPRDHPVQLFTTNYDLLLEQALERAHVPYFDGFVGVHRAFFDPFSMEEDHLPSRWARVWKLHGSINWRRNPATGRVSRSASAKGEQFVIHPSHLKYQESRRMPYLAMLDRLRDFLKQPGATLLSSGYSYNDEHLNEILANGLRGNMSAAVFGLVYGKLHGYDRAIDLTRSCPNLSILAEDEAVIAGRRGGWMPKDVPDPGTPSPLAYSITKVKDGAPGAVAFRLGDFSALGEFVDELIRDRRSSDGGAHGE